jgi:hypothetical protein
MAIYQVKVTPKDGTAAGWMLEYCQMDKADEPVSPVKVVPTVKRDGAFVADLDLADGTNWCFVCTIGDGHSVSIGLTPKAKIYWPRGTKWPVAATGPAHGQWAKVIYFTTTAASGTGAAA